MVVEKLLIMRPGKSHGATNVLPATLPPRLPFSTLTLHPLQIESTVESQSEDAVELIETLTPVGVKPGVGRYVGPSLDLRGGLQR